MEKELIKKIIKFHPSIGVKDGLSIYTGGMKDSGHWFTEKLLDKSEDELNNLYLKYTIAEKEMSSKPITTLGEDKEVWGKIMNDSIHMAMWGSLPEKEVSEQYNNEIKNNIT